VVRLDPVHVEIAAILSGVHVRIAATWARSIRRWSQVYLGVATVM
jgi:hypothetical protein